MYRPIARSNGGPIPSPVLRLIPPTLTHSPADGSSASLLSHDPGRLLQRRRHRRIGGTSPATPPLAPTSPSPYRRGSHPSRCLSSLRSRRRQHPPWQPRDEVARGHGTSNSRSPCHRRRFARTVAGKASRSSILSDSLPSSLASSKPTTLRYCCATLTQDDQIRWKMWLL